MRSQYGKLLALGTALLAASGNAALADGEVYTDRPAKPWIEFETGVSAADGYDAEFIVGVKIEGLPFDGRAGRGEEFWARLGDMYFKLGVRLGDGSVPTYEIDVATIGVSGGASEFEFGKFEFAPFSVSASERLGEKVNFKMDLFGARINAPLGGATPLDDSKLVLLAGLGIRAIGVTVVEYLESNQQFDGFHLADVGAELSAMYRMADAGLHFTVSLGTEVGVSMGHTARAPWTYEVESSVRSELENYLSMKVNLGNYMQLFGRAGISKYNDSGNEIQKTVRELLVGAKFYF